MKDKIVCYWIGLILPAFLACTQPDKGLETPPNIVLILADDQGYGDLGCTGNPILRTPHLDSMAANGAFFEHFFVSAVCSPTRAELLTGRYAVRSGVYGTSEGRERIDLGELTLADCFKGAGYQTAAFGKWHNGMQHPYHPNDRGFEEFVGYCSGHWGSYFDAMLEHNGEPLQTQGFLTDVLTDQAMNFIEKNQHEPFLLYLPLNTPHSPMQVPDQWWRRFDSLDIPSHRYTSRENLVHTRAAYAMVENIDWNVGRLGAKLRELGLADNTIVIYLSDNGPNGWRWNAGLEGIKGRVDEGGVRSPLMMAWPGKIKNTNIGQVAGSIDLLPTLLDLASIPQKTSNPLDGTSLKPLLMGDSVRWPDRMLVNHWRGKTSIRSQRYRLGTDGDLFDMEADPGQTQDLREVFPLVAKAMENEKRRWEDEVLAELATSDSRPFSVGFAPGQVDQLPARDAKPHGNIRRSNRWPNCSFLTNWQSETDSISWEIEVLNNGEYEVELWYTCTKEQSGTQLSLNFMGQAVEAKIEEAFNPPLRGAEHDRVIREESYVKDWASLTFGKIYLGKGQGKLTLRAKRLPQAGGPEVRMILLRSQVQKTSINES